MIQGNSPGLPLLMKWCSELSFDFLSHCNLREDRSSDEAGPLLSFSFLK